jgi:F-type H+-transporting ATPase subunit b
MPQFDSSTYASQIFWLFVSFGFLCIAMRLFVVPRLAASHEAREQKLQEDRNQSKILSSTAEKLRQDNLSRLSEAHGKAHTSIHRVMQEIHQRKTHRLAVLDEELIIKTRNIRVDLENQTQKILDNIEPLVSQVVKATTQRLIGQTMKQTEIKKVVLEALNHLEQS